MKILKIFAVVIAAISMVACCQNGPKQYMGFISDASMNNITVKDLTSDQTQNFSTENADMSQANGLLLGSPVIVDYKGELSATAEATKVATDATYAQAVGMWTMPDPINDSLQMGFKLMVEGAAESINMATLLYTGWELQGAEGKVILKGQSLGNGQTIDFTENATISKIEDGSLVITIDGSGVVFTKSAF